MPSPLSWYFHRLLKVAQRGSVALNHFVQLVAPHRLLFPQPVAAIYGTLHIAHQLRPVWYDGILYALAAATAVLSIQPTLNLFSPNQLMNYSYNPLHLVNTYGAFGSMTRKRWQRVLVGDYLPPVALPDREDFPSRFLSSPRAIVAP